MSRIGRAIGLTRSLAIYHAIPFRQGRMRRLYRTFVQPGDLVFDIGAHAGNRARGLAAVGCRVVALEPHPDFAWLMRRLFARQTRITVVEAAVGQKVARAKLSISDRSPTVTTLAEAWRSARAERPRLLPRTLEPHRRGRGDDNRCPDPAFWRARLRQTRHRRRGSSRAEGFLGAAEGSVLRIPASRTR